MFGSISGHTSSIGYLTSGSKSLSATLDRIRITMANGTDTFDLGSVSVLLEGHNA
jgi:tryptophan synthase alpha subunit